MRVFLETERLVLRRFTEADVDNLFELDRSQEVMHFIPGGAPTPREEIANDILPTFVSYYDRFAGYGFWAALDKASGEFLGWFHFRPPPGAPSSTAELGYRLRLTAWGKGYATEGVRALIRKGFTDYDVQRVVASTMAAHTASRRVMEKAGLRLVGKPTLSVADDNTLEYALDRTDWERWQA
jgi:RimJ/RimL family protein N-acetyltransferase